LESRVGLKQTRSSQSRKARMRTATAVDLTTTSGATGSQPIPHLVIAWILVLPLMFFAVNGSFSFEGAGDGAISGGTSLSGLASPGHNLGLVGYVVIPGIAYSIVMWQLLKNAKRVVLQALQMKFIVLLALLTICSAIWSQDSFRSAYNGAFYCIETLFAFYLVLKFDTEEIQSLVMMTGSVLCFLSLITVFFLPRFGLTHSARDLEAWHGVFPDRTSAAKCLVFLLSPAIIFRGRRFSNRHIVYIAVVLLMIFMAKSATGRVISCIYVALIATISFLSRFGRRSSLLIGAAFLAVGALVAFVGLAYLPLLFEGLGRNATLSGRTAIWTLILRSIAKRPLLGYGFYAFWQGLKGESANAIVGTHWVFGYAHNGILEICLQVGLVGVAIFFVTLFQAMRNAWFCLRNGCPPGVEWYIGIIALTIMYNVDESTVLWPNDLLSILYVVACCGLAKAVRRLKEIKTIEAMYT
jgi:exopolysaccharide production protein ExoQ